jgi:predicted homoserine dehydrogenase-like protein
MIGLHEDLEELEEAGTPIRIGLIGAGQMGVDVVAETEMMKGIRVVATADIDLDRALSAYQIAQARDEVVIAANSEEADLAVQAGKRVAVRDYRIITDMSNIDVMLEATGVPEIGARACLRAARNGHHIAMMNVEADITVGPSLLRYAEHRGVLYALAAGDEPAACKELYDFAKSLGFTVVAAGKGKNNPLDRHAVPTDPAIIADAARRDLSPNMLIEFIDGSKTMIEMAAISNSTGLIPDIRGMHGPETDRERLHKTFVLHEDGGLLSQIGVVDYGVGRVAPGVFLVIRTDHPRLRQAMTLRDMGNGPYYTLFRPYHLCSIEVPLTCAMLSIRKRSNMKPLRKLYSEVFAVAKRDLCPGDILDGIGGGTFYSLIDNFEQARKENLLPVGLAKGAQLLRPVSIDTPICCDDVELHPSTVLDLWQLQCSWFSNQISEEDFLQAIDRLQID